MKSLVCPILVSLLASTASAQWTVTVMHPVGVDGSTLTGGEPGVQSGTVSISGFDSGGLWRGSAGSWVDLSPSQGIAIVRAANGGRVGGIVNFTGRSEASLWNATTLVRTNLNPAGVNRAEINGIGGQQQVGRARLDPNLSTYFAVVWNGTAASCVNLAPAGATDSDAYGVEAGRQVGYVLFSGRNYRASLWSGSAASRVDLNPPNALRAVALGIHGDQQVGWVIDGNQRASLWRGTAASWVDLHPPTGNFSIANAVHNGVQVGYVFYPIVSTAALWRGTAASYENLSLFLPPNLGNHSEATSVWSDATTLYVGGYASDVTTGDRRAVIWSRPLASGCTADFNADGFIDFFDYADFVACFEGSSCDPGRSADINRDGFIDFFDYDAYVTAFETGC